jgi:hypothetical protein
LLHPVLSNYFFNKSWRFTMHRSFKIICVALLLVLGVSVGFGWGTLTHVYLANHLGVKYGPLNLNEMYGATLPDLFGYDFTLTGFTADYAFHTSSDLYWALYGSAVSAPAKAGFYGVFTHNNIDGGVRGADWYAHGVYPIPGQGLPDQTGWVINQGSILVKNPAISTYISHLLGPEVTAYFMPVVGHTLIETAVDILVKRHEDPLAGARLILAAKYRSDEIPLVLAGVFSSIPVPDFPTSDYVLAAEAGYRQQMIGFGQMFMLPERQLIGQISEQTIGVAQMFLVNVLGLPPNQVPQFDANKIAEFIRIAIKQVEPIYHKELMATLCNVEKNLKNFGPPPAGPVFAFWKDGALEQDLAEFKIPSEAPTDFTLNQNYPNPFNPTTNIVYAVPSDSKVTLKVYNCIGQEVATLIDDQQIAGQYVATWDAKGMASGVYICRMQAGNTVLVKKMTLLK